MNTLIVTLICLLFIFLFKNIKFRLDRLFYMLLGGDFCISLIISLFNPFDLYPVSTTSYLYICIGYACFFIGYCVNRTQIMRRNKIPLNQMVVLLLKNRLFWVIYIVSMALVLYLSFTQWQLIMLQGAIGNLKVDIFELLFNNNSALYFIYQVLAFPTFFLSVVLFSYLLINKGEKKHILLFFIYAVVFSFVGGKRGYFAMMFEFYVIVLCVTKINSGEGIKSLVKSSYKIFGIALFVYIGAAFMTSLTGGDYSEKERLRESGEENAKNVVIYTVGAYRAFDFAMNQNYVDKAGGYSWGACTFGGAVEYYGTGILQRLGLPIQTVRARTMNLLQETEIMVGKDTPFNFAYTGFMYFFFDLDLFGIIIFGYLFGWFVRYCLRCFQNDGTVGSLGLICYMFISTLALTGSWFNVELYAQPTLLLFFYLRKQQLKVLS